MTKKKLFQLVRFKQSVWTAGMRSQVAALQPRHQGLAMYLMKVDCMGMARGYPAVTVTPKTTYKFT